MEFGRLILVGLRPKLILTYCSSQSLDDSMQPREVISGNVFVP